MIDTEERILLRDGQPVGLTPKAFDLLAALLEQPGRLTSKEQLLQKVWPGTFVEESNLAYHVFALRKVLGDATANEQYIETVPKRGYRFTAAVTPVQSETAEGRGAREAEVRIAPRWFRRRSVWAGAALVLTIGSLGIWGLRHPSTGVPLHARPLTSLPGVVKTPSLSPDGTHVVFTWSGPKDDNPDLYVQLIGAGAPMRLTSDPGNDYAPSWSPDGRTIAFLRRQPEGPRSEVRLIAPQGGQERTLATVEPHLPPYRPHSVSWCPDSACVLVTDGTEDGPSDAVYAIALATGEKRQMTRPDGLAVDADPVISPDGGTLVFRRDTTPFTGAFYRVSLTNGTIQPGQDAVRLTPRLGAGRPAWMPDGKEIVFSDRGGLWRLQVFNGSAPARLPFVGQDGQAPVVSRGADARLQLVYVRSFSDANLWRIDSNGDGTPAPRSPVAAISSTRFEGAPSLAPTSTKVAFLSDRSGDLEIWIAAHDGSDAGQLTSRGAHPGYPRWSPDGSRVAFHDDIDGHPAVLIVAAGGGPATTLMADGADSGFPTFSRDGRWIYFCSNRSGALRIWKVAQIGGAPVQVTQNVSTFGIESVDGQDLYYVEEPARASSLWRQSLGGGTAVKVLDGVERGSFDVVERGIYYIDRGQPGASVSDRSNGQLRLRYFDFATKRSTIVAPELGNIVSGLSATRDGRTVFFSRIDSSINELMIVSNFR